MFESPWWFLLLLVVAALVAGYVWANRRRLKHTMRFTNLSLLEKVAPKGPGRWRHVPMALVLVALVVLTIALAGPMGTAQGESGASSTTAACSPSGSGWLRATGEPLHH